MVEVFKTSIPNQTEASLLEVLLRELFPGARVAFDLDDCDRILKMEGDNFAPERVMQLLESRGFICQVLD